MTAAPFVLLTVVLTGCRGASEGDGPTGPGGDSPFGREDLVRIVPRPSEAPEGMQFSQTLRGEAVLRRLLTAPTPGEVRRSGASGRFISGLERAFEDPGGPVLHGGALLFKNSSAAQRFFQVLAIDYATLEVEGGIERTRPLRAFSLGQESFGMKGSLAPRLPRESVILLVWRQRNLVLYLRAFGVSGMAESADAALAREVARTMDSEVMS